MNKPISSDRILVTCFDNIGDLVFISAVTANLRNHFPNAQITLWCKEYTSAIAHLLPGIDEVVCSDPYWDKSPHRGKGSFNNFWSKWKLIKKQNFDLAVVTGACWRSAFYTRLAGVSQRIGFNKRKAKWFLSDTVQLYRRDKPVVQELLRLLDPLRIEKKYDYYHLNHDSIEENKDVPQRMICLHAFAGSPKRCASLELWFEFAHWLKEQAYSIAWVGTERELEQIRATGLFDETEFATYYYKEKSILGLSKFVVNSELFIGHDSGPLHMAGALGVKVLGLYLPGEYKRTFPQSNTTSRLISKQSPAELELDEVKRAFLELVESEQKIS